MTESIFTLANERMSIIEACQQLGMDIPDYGTNMKLHCPFGHLLHSDEGFAKAFRIYPLTNTAYCFACQERYTPVKLIAMDRDISEEAAAEAILLETNYVAPDYVSQWDALVNRTQIVDTDYLAEALKVSCQRLSPDWEDRQYEEAVAKKLGACLNLLGKVHTEDDAAKWLSTAREVMRRTLEQK